MSHRQQAPPLQQQQDEHQQQIIGGYRLGREIGKGSFAVVVKAYHHRTRSPAAIKVVTRKKLTTKLLENLEGEISILKSIQHPNIVELHDCLKTESHIYLIMAYCSCGDLSQYIKKRASNSNPDLADSSQSSTFDLAHAEYQHPHDGGLHDAIVRSFLSQLASAIEFMRAMNIVHRDIKPQNLLLQHPESRFVRAGHPHGIHQLKVADFGFARSLPAAALAETLCGSPLYMAPEILRYEKYDAKADLWSVGAVLFEMAVGKAPFRAQNHIELLRKIERGEDRIKFPDERTPGSIARENARRAQTGDPPLVPAHPIEDDIKHLIRSLLKRKAVERLSFEDFFRSPVIQHIEMMASVAGLEVSTTISPLHHHHHHHPPSQQHTAPTSISSASSASPISQREQSPEQVLAAAAAAAAAAPASDAPIPGSSSSFISAGPRQPYDQHQQQPQHPGHHHHQLQHTPRSNAHVALSDPPPSLPTHQQQQQRQQEEDDRVYEDMQSDQVLQDVAGMAEDPSGGAGTGMAGDGSGHGSTDDAYVLIEKRNVEVNALADELAQHGHIQQQQAQQQQQQQQQQRRQQQGFAVSPSQQARYYQQQGQGLGVHHRSHSTSNVPLAGPSMIGLQHAGAQPSPVTSRISQQQPIQQPAFGVGSTGFSPSSLTGAGSQPVNIPPPPSSNDMMGGAAGGPGPSSASSSSSLARAISLASVKLFGVPTGMSLRGAAALMRMQSQRRLSNNGGNGSPAGGGFRGGFAGLDSPVLVGQSGIPGGSSAVGGGGGPGDYYASASAGLLVTLEDLSQKAFVLSEFGDSRLATYFPTGPHQPQQQGASASGGSGAGTVSVEMMLGEAGPGNAGGMSPATTAAANMSPAAPAQQLSPQGGPAAQLEPGSIPRYASRRSNSSTSIPGGPSSPFGQQQTQEAYYQQQQQLHASPTMQQQQQQQQQGMSMGGPTPAEVAATEALMLYVRALNFIQRGTDMVRTFLDVHHQQQQQQQQSLFSRGSLGGYPSSLPHQHQQTSHTHSSSSSSSTALGNASAPTPEINEAVQWLRARFNDTYEKAEFAKARSGDMPESAQETDKLIFDRALEIARAAAVDELENNREGAGWDRTNCVLAYETAQAMLLTLLDPSEEDMALSETSMGTVEKFVRSISKRLHALRLPLTPVQT